MKKMRRFASRVTAALLVFAVMFAGSGTEILAAGIAGVGGTVDSQPCVSGIVLKEDEAGNVFGAGIVDGTEPFDNNDEKGNDSSSGNGRVRSNDTVTYNIETTIASGGQNIIGEKIWYEFTVPDDEEMTLDWSAMGISEPEKIAAEGKKIFRFSVEIPENAATGSGSVTVPIILKVGNKTEGYSIEPEIRAWYGENTGEAKEKAQEVENVKAVQVTSAPLYNIILKSGTITGKTEYDFTDNPYNGDAYQENSGKVLGFGAAYGIALEMANRETSKGMRGIEFPDPNEDFTFTVTLTGTYNGTDITKEFTPLLYVVSKNNNNDTLGIPRSDREDILPK